jgi:hypothetical protein
MDILQVHKHAHASMGGSHPLNKYMLLLIGSLISECGKLAKEYS